MLVMHTVKSDTGVLGQGMLEDGSFIRKQKATLMADLLLVAGEVNTCATFKLKIVDPCP